MKQLIWMASTRRNILAMPRSIRQNFGYALYLAQNGDIHPDAKPWKGTGPGVHEVVESHDGNAYRCVYTVRFAAAVYVLHAWQKKSPAGRRTAKTDVELIKTRLKAAQRDYEESHGKKAKR